MDTHTIVRELSQEREELWIRTNLGTEQWTIIYQDVEQLTSGIAIYSGLIPLEKVQTSLRSADWDRPPGRDGPALSSSGIFSRNWNDLDIEPVAIVQEFQGRQPTSVQIAEDVRLLFNLYDDRADSGYFVLNDDGTETLVAKVLTGQASILTTFLRRYLAARQMGLLIQFDSMIWQELVEGGAEVELPASRTFDHGDTRIDFWSEQGDRYRFSRLLGKKVLRPLVPSRSEIWPFPKSAEYVEFVVGEDETGNSITHTCDPRRVPSTWTTGGNRPNRLTPVFFSNEVLRKYYANPDRYEVYEDGIRCNPVWLLRADTSHPEHVSAFLGDLGTDIPTTEQWYWRAHNISPVGRSMSKAAISQSLNRELTKSELTTFRFKRSYAEATSAWVDSFGWPLFKDLHPGDRHVLVGLHVPLQNTHADFDHQLGNLAKVLVDSLNEEAVAVALGNESPPNERGIAKLDRLLKSDDYSYAFVTRDTKLLAGIQGLRSQSVAHRKSSSFDLAVAGLNPKNLRGSFDLLLSDCVQALDCLAEFARVKSSQRAHV